MDSSIMAKVLNLTAFNNIFSILEETDREYGGSIKRTLTYNINTIQKKLENADSLLEKEYLLFQLKYLLKEQSIKYRDKINMQLQIELRLKIFAHRSKEKFLENVFLEYTEILEHRKEKMLKDLMKKGKWSDDLTDSAKKGGQFIFNSTQSLKWKISNNNHNEVKEKKLYTLSEELIKAYFDVDDLALFLQSNIRKQYKVYENGWKDFIEKEMFDNLNLSDNQLDTMDFPHRSGISTNVAAMGLTSGLAGTLGLAMGWHTLSYSLANVFPPVALFTLITTVGVGIMNKNKMLEKKREELIKMVEQYKASVHHSLSDLPHEELDNKTLPAYLSDNGEFLTEKALQYQVKEQLGNLSIKMIEELIEALSLHENYVEEWLDEIREKRIKKN